jgi:hypothetical protein
MIETMAKIMVMFGVIIASGLFLVWVNDSIETLLKRPKKLVKGNSLGFQTQNFKYLQGINGIRHLLPALAVKDKSSRLSDRINMEILSNPTFKPRYSLTVYQIPKPTVHQENTPLVSRMLSTNSAFIDCHHTYSGQNSQQKIVRIDFRPSSQELEHVRVFSKAA